jgi:hypothetical protein
MIRPCSSFVRSFHWSESNSKAADWMAHDASEDIVEVLPRIDIEELARLNQAQRT